MDIILIIERKKIIKSNPCKQYRSLLIKEQTVECYHNQLRHKNYINMKFHQFFIKLKESHYVFLSRNHVEMLLTSTSETYNLIPLRENLNSWYIKLRSRHGKREKERVILLVKLVFKIPNTNTNLTNKIIKISR